MLVSVATVAVCVFNKTRQDECFACARSFLINGRSTGICSQGCQSIVDTGTSMLTAPQQYLGYIMQAIGAQTSQYGDVSLPYPHKHTSLAGIHSRAEQSIEILLTFGQMPISKSQKLQFIDKYILYLFIDSTWTG